MLDATGIKGAYNFTLSFSGIAGVSPAQAALAATSQSEATDPGGGITLFAALEKQLGLKLEKRNIQVPVIALDHTERADGQLNRAGIGTAHHWKSCVPVKFRKSA
jgi:uncharacterized protein (TIGR03435 family)